MCRLDVRIKIYRRIRHICIKLNQYATNGPVAKIESTFSVSDVLNVNRYIRNTDLYCIAYSQGPFVLVGV